jgi:hypothetical protein
VFPTSSGGRKLVLPAAAKNAAPLALPLPAVLRQSEEQTTQTIRPTNRFPRSAPGAISKSPPREIGPILEDYSDLGIDEDDEWQEKFTDFKMKTSVRRGLFHPNDIKTVGLAPSPPGAKSAPLPDVNGLGHTRAQSHPLNAITPLSATPFTMSSRTRSHSPHRACPRLPDRPLGSCPVTRHEGGSVFRRYRGACSDC